MDRADSAQHHPSWNHCRRCRTRRTYARYPVWVAVIAAPILAVIEGAAWVLEQALHPHPSSPTLQRFFAGDMAGAYTLAVYYRPQFVRFAGFATVLAVIFFTYNLRTRGHLFQSYFVDQGVWPEATFAGRFGLQLVSPSRGLFIFCPLALFSCLGMWLAWRRRWLFPLAPWLIFIFVVQVLLVTRYFWPGVCYGPRYFMEIIPILTLFLIPVLQTPASRAWPGAFVLAAAWGIFVQARGATDFAVHRWNGEPAHIDQDRARVWDWRDPQFLRGLH